ncbi:MAG: serine protease [Anaerolineales bacterium]|nr:serine protease [Anaerolineales bacterium]
MALIPPFFLDCTVAIGFDAPDGHRQYAATGFLYGRFLKQEGESKTYQVFLVTNKHVFEGASLAWLRFNPEGDETAKEFDLNLFDANGKQIWLAHPDSDVDLAVVRLSVGFLKEQGVRFNYFRSDQHIANRKRALDLGFSEGDSIFVLGFPMGLVGEKRNFVIVRQGAIARIRDSLSGNSKEILIDTFIFPGNSGGPVVTKPEVISIEGTKAVSSAYLIGVVTAYVPYRDVAVSTQTNRPRVIFEENSGLASVVPIDYVIDIIETASKTLKEGGEETPVETIQGGSPESAGYR